MNRGMMVEATIANMRAHYGPGVFAWSPDTDEEYSADPGDYFWLPENEPLEDIEGNAMILVRRVSYLEPVEGQKP